MKEIITLVLVTITAFAILALLAGLAWYTYYRAIPQILQSFASQQKFIGIIPEFSWAAITVSGVFKYGKINKAGYSLSSNDQTAKIVSTPNPSKKTWLGKRGFTWLGFDAPRITRFAEKQIAITVLNPSRKETDPLEKWVTNRTKLISNLYLSFPMYMLVENIDTTDTQKVSVLIMGEIEVIVPYLTWYGQGGQAYKVIGTRIEKRVREVFERYSLRQLILETSQDDAERDLKAGLSDCDDLGVVVNTITIVEWDWKADDDFKRLLEDPKVIELREQAILRELELQKAEAEREVTIAESKVAAAKALQKVNAAEWQSLLEKFGGNAELAATSVLKEHLGEDGFAAQQLSEALKKTGVTGLGDGFLTMIKERKQS